MRFIENGPSIPDELLTARDEGRVVFFCGAGVSRASAKLPDFFGLANNVVQRLGVPEDHSAYKILREVIDIERRTGEKGLISADRIFGLLERDFPLRDIESAVSGELQPLEGVDLSAHRTLLDLATTQEGKIRLVTTNFDRLFDDCDSNLTTFQPPHLPNPSRQSEMDGVVYLHGCTTKDYKSSEGESFILSSSEFGRAYLSEGWATTFFREILDRYIVVFIGYSADDPPVQYLLEALNKVNSQLTGVYAFQEGESDSAAAIWRHKGVEAIPYLESDGHRALWDTLEAWSIRAKDPEQWSQSVIDLAAKGPVSLQPHERGQVAHIISTLEGARKFSEGDSPPPADWLCTFDPHRRFAKPSSNSFQGPYIDPFDLYGLDSDIAPNKIEPDDYHTKREIPETAWDAFTSTRLDRKNLHDNHFSAIRGHWAANVPILSPRLKQIGVWIGKVADQPATVWWAASQHGLHPDIVQSIKWQLAHSENEISLVIRQAWNTLFESRKDKNDDYHHDWYELKSVIKKNGWDNASVRKFADIHQPYLIAQGTFYGRIKPPENTDKLRIDELFRRDVKYPKHQDGVDIPDEFLISLIRLLRKNLELALQLEMEIGGYELTNISPIVEDDSDKNIDHYSRTNGLSESIIFFSSLFSRLVSEDTSLALKELITWPVNDDTIFSRLRIWACGKKELVSVELFEQIISGLSNKAFWDRSHQRDLLLVLANRWNDLTEKAKEEIGVRILNGREKWDGEDEDEFSERQAWLTLDRLVWLTNKGCYFSFNLDSEIDSLRKIATKWQPQHAEKACDSIESRGGTVRTDTKHSSLLHAPISTILSRAVELSGRDEDFLVEKAPFSGLANKHPVRAFTALTHAAQQNEYPEWAWRTFLNLEIRKDDKPRFSALIAERICQYSDKSITEFIYPLSGWLFKVSKQLSSSFPETFDKIMSKLINVLRSEELKNNSAIIRSNEPEWVMQAINSAAGKLAEALFEDPRHNGLQSGEGFPQEWIVHVNDLLSLNGDHRQYALVIFSHNMNWFYQVDPMWTNTNLLSSLVGANEDDRNAMWSGFFWGEGVRDQALYLRIKADLLIFAKNKGRSHHGFDKRLTGIILAGWGTIVKKKDERLISNEELRDVLLHVDDEFRSDILWQITMWVETTEDEANKRWGAMLPEFLQNVWPRQKIVKSPNVSARLFDLAFSTEKNFPDIAEIILPLLTTVDHEYLMFPELRKSKNNIVDNYPDETLALLYAVLPEVVTTWPHDIIDVLQRISEADTRLNSDERLLELKRRWNAR